MNFRFDWSGVFSGAPLQWLVSGLITTLCITIVASVVATLLAFLLLALRLSSNPVSRWPAKAVISVFRNTPLLVQLMFWYFAGFGLLPQAFRTWMTDPNAWAVLPGNVVLISPEFFASSWGLGLFSAVFIAEEVRAGLGAISRGQQEAAISQGFSYGVTLRHILLPQALANSFQPVVGQYLNLMKFSSLACAIGLAEITYQVRQIESFNSHALEAFAVGTGLYLLIGFLLSWFFNAFRPKPGRKRLSPEGTITSRQTSETKENSHGA